MEPARSARPTGNGAMPAKDEEYWAFISYGHADKRWAARLQHFFESYSIPPEVRGTLPARLTPVFRDREVLGAAHNLSEEIRRAIVASRSMVVICSPESAKSVWVKREVELFMRTHGDARIFCLIVERADGSLQAPELLPEPLRPEVCGREILAADARPTGDGAKRALLKTLAGVAGISYPVLARSQERRAARRQAVAWATTLALVCVISSLGVAALWQAREARREASRAEATSKYLFSALIDFLPRSAKGIPTGALLPLIDANARPEKLALLEGEPEALFHVRKFLAEAYLQLDQRDKAVAMLETNLAAGRSLLGDDHEDVIHQHWRLATAYNEAGRGEQAETLQRQLLQVLADRPPDDPMRLDALNGLANCLATQGKTEEADRLYSELYDLSQTHLPPDHSGRLIYTSNYVNALLRAGQTAEALTVSCANLEQSEKLRGPSHPETSFARYQQGLALVNVGDLEAASVAFGQAAKDLRISVGPEHYLTLLNGYSVTASLWQLGREEEARAAGAEYFGSPPDPERVKASGKADDPVFEFLAESAVGADAPRK